MMSDMCDCIESTEEMVESKTNDMIGGSDLHMFELSPIWLSCFLVICESTFEYDNFYSDSLLPIFSSPPDSAPSGIESHLPPEPPYTRRRIVDHGHTTRQLVPWDKGARDEDHDRLQRHLRGL